MTARILVVDDRASSFERIAAFAGLEDIAAALLMRSDQALYRAKRDGRNRVVPDAAYWLSGDSLAMRPADARMTKIYPQFQQVKKLICSRPELV